MIKRKVQEAPEAATVRVVGAQVGETCRVELHAFATGRLPRGGRRHDDQVSAAPLGPPSWGPPSSNNSARGHQRVRVGSDDVRRKGLWAGGRHRLMVGHLARPFGERMLHPGHRCGDEFECLHAFIRCHLATYILSNTCSSKANPTRRSHLVRALITV